MLPAMLGACGFDQQGDELLVLSASSLAGPMRELAERYEAEHGVTVRVATGSSAGLREQVLDGAPAAVFISASEEIMAELVAGGWVTGLPQPLATNHLVIGVQPGNPQGLVDPGDLTRSSLRIGACVAQAPCGILAQRAQTVLGLSDVIDGREANAGALRAKMELGEYDVALLYASDAHAAGGHIEVVPTAQLAQVQTTYSVAVMAESPDFDASRAFVDWMVLPRNTAVLAEYGFTLHDD